MRENAAVPFLGPRFVGSPRAAVRDATAVVLLMTVEPGSRLLAAKSDAGCAVRKKGATCGMISAPACSGPQAGLPLPAESGMNLENFVRHYCVQSGLMLLLSVAMLTGGVMPSAVRHMHAHGEQVHQHDECGEETVEHRHDHPNSHAPGDDSETAQAVTSHQHLVLFGFRFCAPAGEEQDTPRDSEELDRPEAVLIRMVDTDTVLVASAARSWLSAVWCLAAALRVSVDSPSAPALRSGRDVLSSLPLCDTARGERSGVLLT